jgi:hypothetical protein
MAIIRNYLCIFILQIYSYVLYGIPFQYGTIETKKEKGCEM